MSTTSPTTIHLDELADRQNMVTVIEMLMAKAHIKTTADLARVVSPEISKSVLYERMKCATPFNADELRVLGRLFDVHPGAFFTDPDEVEIRSRCSDPRPALTVVQGQNHEPRRPRPAASRGHLRSVQ